MVEHLHFDFSFYKECVVDLSSAGHGGSVKFRDSI
jgi:hypothetical protein